MKAIMISDYAKWCALMMNGDKTVEVRAGTALYKAIQKLIDEYGYADIFVHCSKIQRKHYHLIEVIDTDTGKAEYEIDYYIGSGDYLDYCYDGKVAFKFRCYKVEEIECYYEKDSEDNIYLTEELNEYDFLNKTQLKQYELDNYFSSYDDDIVGTAIHISDLEIFDRPKELSEFQHIKPSICGKKDRNGLYQCDKCTYGDKEALECRLKITKAPQHFCYVEVE